MAAAEDQGRYTVHDFDSSAFRGSQHLDLEVPGGTICMLFPIDGLLYV